MKKGGMYMLVIEINYLFIEYKMIIFRSVDIDIKLFRENLNEIVKFMIYEVIKNLKLEIIEVIILLMKI